MKSFSFRLESILGYRSYLEKNAQKNLLIAMNECRTLEREIEVLSKKRFDIAGEISLETVKGIDVWQYEFYTYFLQKLERDLKAANDGLKDAKGNVKKKETELKKESIKKKSLETLKDLQQNRYIRSMEKEEQKALDELAVLRRGRI